MKNLYTTLFGGKLNPKIRWVELANLLPWEKSISLFAQKMSSHLGRKAINPRVVLGALILKHKKNSADEEIIEILSTCRIS